MPGTKYGSSVAILAPRGRDALVARSLLEDQGIDVVNARSVDELAVLVRELIGVALVAEEALAEVGLPSLVAALKEQPTWSDIPFIVLTNGMNTQRCAAEEQRINALGNVVLLARPLHRDDILRATRSALKARQRQFEARHRLEELHKREKELAESEHRLHAIANSVDNMIWSTQPDGFHDYYNDRWYEFTGVPRGSTDGEEWNGVFHPDDQDRAWKRWRHSLETGEPYEIEYRLRHHTGKYRWVLGKAKAVRDDDDNIIRWYGSCTDIDELIRVREKLTQSRDVLERAVAERTQELADLYRKTPVLLHSLDHEGRLISVSDRWLSFMGFERAEDVLGRLASDFVAPESLDDHRGSFRERVAREGVVYDLPYRVVRKNGEIADVQISARATRNEKGEVERVMASVVDLTEHKKIEAERDAAEAQLRQSQKLETIGQLTGGIAHDFNNLLMAIKSSLELLRRRIPEDDSRARSFLDNALAGTERGAILTQRMLAFARKQELDTRPVDLARLLPGMRDLLERSIGPQIDITLHIAPRVADALVDANQLEMAILNLAVNARDAMEGQGHMHIALECVDMNGTPGLSNGNYVRIAVEDDGPGMDANTLAKATEPFFTTKGVGKGTGLGLSMVHGLATQSNGLFRLQSEPGKGTTAEIFLPVASNSSEGTDGQMHSAAETSTEEARPLVILAVDDDALVLFGTVALLEDLGHEVIEAGSGASALQVLDERDDIDLVITDQAMPNMTGVELAHAIHEKRPQMPIVLASGYAEMPEGAKEHIAARLEKPFSDEMLSETIQTVFSSV